MNQEMQKGNDQRNFYVYHRDKVFLKEAFQHISHKFLEEMDIQFQMNGSYFKIPFSEKILDILFLKIKGENIQIRHAKNITMTLEDLFIKNIKRGDDLGKW